MRRMIYQTPPTNISVNSPNQYIGIPQVRVYKHSKITGMTLLKNNKIQISMHYKLNVQH